MRREYDAGDWADIVFLWSSVGLLAVTAVAFAVLVVAGVAKLLWLMFRG